MRRRRFAMEYASRHQQRIAFGMGEERGGRGGRRGRGREQRRAAPVARADVGGGTTKDRVRRRFRGRSSGYVRDGEEGGEVAGGGDGKEGEEDEEEEEEED